MIKGILYKSVGIHDRGLKSCHNHIITAVNYFDWDLTTEEVWSMQKEVLKNKPNLVTFHEIKLLD